MNKKGFTLVEVIVVISILAILAGMLIPAISLMKKTSQTTANGTTIKYSDLIGKTIDWNGNSVFVTLFNGHTYKVVVNNSVTVDADRNAIVEAYRKQLQNKIEN